MDASSPPPPLESLATSERTAADLQLMAAAHGFLYVGDVDRAGIEEAACAAFRALRRDGCSPEAALAHVKAVTHGMMAGSLRTLDEQSFPWLRDSLVRWMITSYF